MHKCPAYDGTCKKINLCIGYFDLKEKRVLCAYGEVNSPLHIAYQKCHGGSTVVLVMVNGNKLDKTFVQLFNQVIKLCQN